MQKEIYDWEFHGWISPGDRKIFSNQEGRVALAPTDAESPETKENGGGVTFVDMTRTAKMYASGTEVVVKIPVSGTTIGVSWIETSIFGYMIIRQQSGIKIDIQRELRGMITDPGNYSAYEVKMKGAESLSCNKCGGVAFHDENIFDEWPMYSVLKVCCKCEARHRVFYEVDGIELQEDC